MNNEPINSTVLEDLFRNKMFYAVEIASTPHEKRIYHDKFPYPHISLFTDLKSSKFKGLTEHELSINFSKEEYKAFKVKAIDNVHDNVDGLILFAAMRSKLGRQIFDTEKYKVAEIIIDKIMMEVHKLIGPTFLLNQSKH